MKDRLNFNKLQQNIAIYGAQMVGVSVYYALKEIAPECHIVGFIVSDCRNNPVEIDGVKVVCLDEFKDFDTQILIATPENHHAVIVKDLSQRGFHNYICINSEIEAQMMKCYYDRLGMFPSLIDLGNGTTKPEVCVYTSKCYKDQKLAEVLPGKSWIKPIQAGASLTDVRVADICDNEGDNISDKNVNYSELSAMYWIGKHVAHEYMGLFHYRRMLDICEDDFFKLPDNGVDVILPYPTVHYPNIEEHHKRYIKEDDWKAMQKALVELAPEYAKAMPKIFAGQYFYNYNMLIARQEVFKQYCDWLFPILERVEELSNPKGNERADRYIGYLGENLMTLFFMYHKDDLRIVHTGRKMFL